MSRPGNLATRLIAWFVGLAILPSAILASVAYAQIGATDRSYFLNHLATAASTRAAGIEDHFHGLRGHTRLLVAHSRDLVEARLDAFPASVPEGIRYGFAAPDGRLIVAGGAAPLSGEALARLRAGGLVEHGEEFLVGSPADDGGAAFATCRKAWLLERVSDTAGPGKSGQTYLVNTEGRRLDRAETWRLPLEGQAEPFLDAQGVKVLAASAPAGRWRVVAQMDMAEIEGPLQRLALGVLALGALFFLLVVAALIVVGRRAERSLQAMVESLQQAARGEFGSEVKEYGTPAVRQVGEALNEMHRRLAERDAEILKQRQELFCQRCELERLNTEIVQADRMKSEFVANMSHEVRTPLHSILSLGGLLLEGASGALAPEQRRQVEIIERNGRALLAMLGDILDFSKIGAGYMDVIPGDVSPAAVVAGVREVIAPLAQRKGIRVILEIPPDMPRLRTDEEKLHRILLNLAHNAVKFTAVGSVTLRLAEEEGARMRFEVEDTGAGIAKEAHERIFEPFQQADGSMSRAAGGTGLGLAIARSLTELLGGRIAVDSTLGQGTLFRVTLPRRIGPRVTGAGRGASEAQEVLVVGATPPAGEAMRAELSAAGIRAGRAVCGRDVRTALEREGLRALLCDVGLFANEGLDVFSAFAGRIAASGLPAFGYWMNPTEGVGASIGTLRFVEQEEGGHRLDCEIGPSLSLPASVGDEDRRRAAEWIEAVQGSGGQPLHGVVRELVMRLDRALVKPVEADAEVAG